MSKRILLIAGKPTNEHLQLLHNADEGGVIRGFVCRPEYKCAVQNEFPNADVFVDSSKIKDIRSNWRPHNTNRTDIQKLTSSKYLIDLLFMTQRLDEKNDGVLSAFEYVYEAYLCSAKALKLAKPDVLVFTNYPHTLFSYALYANAKLNNYNVRIVSSAGGELSHLIFEQSRLGDLPALSDIDLDRPLGPESQQFVCKCNSLAPPYYMVDQGYEAKSNNVSRLYYRQVIEKIKDAIYKFLRQIRNREYRLSCEAMAKWKALETRGDDLPTRDYIYFPLHYQPEQTTMPCANAYAAQYGVLADLISATPSGIPIVVKEHPSMLLKKRSDYIQYRSSFFADLIEVNDNVYLAPAMKNGKELLESSLAVAALTGTIGYEALARAIPVLVFGDAVYKSAGGCIICTDSDDIEAGLSSIISGAFRVPENALEDLLRKLESVAEKIPNYILNRIALGEPESIKLGKTYLAGKIVKSLSKDS